MIDLTNRPDIIDIRDVPYTERRKMKPEPVVLRLPEELAAVKDQMVDPMDGLIDVEHIVDRDKGIDRTVLTFESGRIEDWDNVTDKLVSLTNPHKGLAK